MAPDVIRCLACGRPGTIVYISGTRITSSGVRRLRTIAYGCRPCNTILVNKEVIELKISPDIPSILGIWGGSSHLLRMGEWRNGILVKPIDGTEPKRIY